MGVQTRRDFLRNAAMLTGTAFVSGSIPEAIAKALAIDPATGSTFLDAEHVVILMQENRSFDHCYGALRGVRGFRDPRAHVLPDGNPVWFQTDPDGHTYAPFRLDIKETKSTWMGSLPHSWSNQVDARNGGRYDRWLTAKPSGYPGAKGMPLTLGHYTRADIPFYYALADAFTVCDGHFCSSLTGTTPNRLFLWTGKLREDAQSPARVDNGDCDYDSEASWITFPERLETAGVSWRIYQNEISLDSGFHGEEDSWLSNFTDNPMEWFSQYNVRFAKGYRANLDRQISSLPKEIEALKREGKDASEREKRLVSVKAERTLWGDERWATLSPRAKAIHERAFTTNEGDPHYRELETLKYQYGDTVTEVKVPKGDILYRFRKDVETGTLPAVSWIVAPENFSDHPGAAWYGAWYVSEVLNILTKDPEVWKKTIFILTYDENDGYFDHVPPFVAPFPARPDTGRVTDGIDATTESADIHGRESAIGLGYRVPLVVASPWSRGGCVNSEVFDHTSSLQLLEKWLGHKGTPVRETNISDWRRTICGDLTSVFKPYNGENLKMPSPLVRDAVVESIHRAREKSLPSGFSSLAKDEIGSVDVGQTQEPGTRPSCPLAYELVVNAMRKDGGLAVTMEARQDAFGEASLGTPFNAYAYGEIFSARSYTVEAGKSLEEMWPVADGYHIRIDGPNGFMREFRGGPGAAPITVLVRYAGGKRPNGRVEVQIGNGGSEEATAAIRDEAYGTKPRTLMVPARTNRAVMVETKGSHGWYDFTVAVGAMSYRYAGRVETGRWSTSDPAMV